MDCLIYLKEIITGILDKQSSSVQLEIIHFLEQLTKEWKVKNNISRNVSASRLSCDVGIDKPSDCLLNKQNGGEFITMGEEDEQMEEKSIDGSNIILNHFLSSTDDGDSPSKGSAEMLQLLNFDDQHGLALHPLFSAGFSVAIDCKHEIEVFHPENSCVKGIDDALQGHNNNGTGISDGDLCKSEPGLDDGLDDNKKKDCDRKHVKCERKRKTRSKKTGNQVDAQSWSKQPLTICEICGARVKIIKVHMMQHGERVHTCPYCSYTSHQRGTIGVHIRRLHTNERPHLCEICGKGFVKSSLLRNHISVKHSQVKRDRSFKCPECKFSTFTQALLDGHVINRHRPYRRPVFKCDQCDAQLCSSHSLKEHMKLCHTDERPFPCTICEFAAKSAKRLKNHMIYHSEKAFKCDTCEKMFFTQLHLRRHQLVHTRTTDFSCPYCRYQCNLAENLRKHCRSIHGVTYPAKKRLSYQRTFPKSKECQTEHLGETVVCRVPIPEGPDMINCSA